MLSASLTRQVEDTLQSTADDILRASQVSIGGIPLSSIQLQLDLTANVFVQIFDNDRILLHQTMNFAEVGHSFDDTALETEVPIFTSRDFGEARIRVLTVPVYDQVNNNVLGYIQLAESLATVDQARELLLFILIGGGLIAVGAAAIVGWITAGAALRPIGDLTETALQITRADDLSQRIPHAGHPNDEVGQLIATFNETLERLENLFETQRRFMADVSHELRTPLTSIKAYTETLLDSVDDGDIATQKVFTIPHAYVTYDHWREEHLPALLGQLKEQKIDSIGRYGIQLRNPVANARTVRQEAGPHR